MISKETLECVEVGILTDVQLFEAISHYTELENSLKCHGERYHLVWKDVFYTLNTLKQYEDSRKRNNGKRIDI